MNKWRRLRAATLALPFMTVMAASAAFGGNTATPGLFVVEPPTLENLGFEWYINPGDDANHNATVEVKYRKKGDPKWNEGMNLLRIMNEQNNQGTGEGLYIAPNMFAGSVFDLEPDTDYEVQFEMKDPDGVTGNPFQSATVHTRPVPKPFPGGNVYDVYPAGNNAHNGHGQYIGLLDAYYQCTTPQGLGIACAPRVKPGDTIKVHAGTYTNDPLYYPGIGIDGTYHLTAQGTADKPITIIAAGDGPVIFDGGMNHNLFDVMAADYHIFKNITVQATDIGFLAGIKDIAGSQGLSVIHCTLQNVGFAIWNEFAHSMNFYVTDNTVIGRDDPTYMSGWNGSPSAVPGTPSWTTLWEAHPENAAWDYPDPIAGPTRSYLGIKLYGSGNVVAYNEVANFHDGIDIDTHGLPEGYPDPTFGPSLTPRNDMPVSNDFYNNYIHHLGDNCGESDGSLHNMRTMREFCFDGAEQPTSSQPTFAGPVYYIRNVVYNDWGSAIKWSGAGGDMYLHNSINGLLSSSGGSNAHFYNNLFLGRDTNMPTISIGTFTNYTALDYNGYRNDIGVANPYSFNSPPFGVLQDYNSADQVSRSYPSLAAYQAGTGQDKHSILVDWNVFKNAPHPGSTDYELVHTPDQMAQIDLTLAPGSVAIDAGMVFHNINDDYTGKAPDLGAYEYGKPVPHYGPRDNAGNDD